MKFVIGLFINSKALPNAVWRIAINILVHLGRLLQRRLKCQCIPSQLNCAKAPFRNFLNYIQHQLLYFIWAVPYDGVTTNEA